MSNPPPVPRSWLDRIQGVLRLDANTFEEIEADTSATSQAALVVGAVAVAGAIGALASGAVAFAVLAVVLAFVSWLVWTVVAFFVGTRFFGGQATWDQLLRTLGFAQAPGLLNVLGVVPLLGAIAAPVAFVWVVAASVVAIRQALDFTTEKAVLTAVVTAVILVIVNIVPMILFGAGIWAISR